MVLGGLALAFSRLIDNSVVVLENIFRHLEMGETAEVAAERGGQEVAMPVLAATFTTAIVFFPVVFLYGVSRFLFTALAAAVVFSLFASFHAVARRPWCHYIPVQGLSSPLTEKPDIVPATHGLTVLSNGSTAVMTGCSCTTTLR